jgi:hypothetical protein
MDPATVGQVVLALGRLGHLDSRQQLVPFLLQRSEARMHESYVRDMYNTARVRSGMLRSLELSQG